MLSVEQAAAFRYSTVHRYITGCTFKQGAAENGSGWLGSSSAPEGWSYSACGSPAPLLLLLIFLLKVACLRPEDRAALMGSLEGWQTANRLCVMVCRLLLPLPLRMELAEHGWKALVGIKTHETWVRNLLLGGWGAIAWWAKVRVSTCKTQLACNQWSRQTCLHPQNPPPAGSALCSINTPEDLRSECRVASLPLKEQSGNIIGWLTWDWTKYSYFCQQLLLCRWMLWFFRFDFQNWSR